MDTVSLSARFRQRNPETSEERFPLFNIAETVYLPFITDRSIHPMSQYGRIFQPFSIGPFTIVPEGDEPPDPCGVPLVLGKKGAFGSGEHETTAACLEFMAALPNGVGNTVLDLGSGTGILAIAASRLGASRVVALDIEWPAALSCAENVRLNGMEERIFSICGELGALGNTVFDTLLANIYADIHLALAGSMAAMTKPGGYLILSGIPLQDKFDVQKTFLREGCEMIDSRIGEEYATFVMGKR
jgi:ribosomal protein L11 methyltransferase